MTGLVSCTMDCNLACKYCFEGNGQKCNAPDSVKINAEFKSAIDDIDTYIDVIYKYNNSKKTTIIWHGGEPTLVDPCNMEIIMKSQRDKGHDIKWEIQTNGTIITDEHIRVFKEYDVGVGISLDGMKRHHDKYRVTKAGKPTYDLIISNINRLKQERIKHGVLITITDNNVGDLLEIYDYLASHDIGFSYNALYPTEQGATTLTEEDFGEKICQLFDRWITDNSSKIMIGPFVQIIEGILKPERGIPACNWQKDCGKSFVAINTDGKIYPCEHWVGYEDKVIEKISKDMNEDALISDFFSQRAEWLEKNDCKDCDIFKFCYGGCPWNAMVLNGNAMSKDKSICVGRKKLIKHIYDYIKENKGDEITEMKWGKENV